LSDKLITMVQAVQGIRPAKARDLAMEAVIQETSLINHLLNYNAYFSNLLQTLKLKFTGDNSYDEGGVKSLVSNMNLEAREINSSNDAFNQKLQEFDAAIE